MQHFLVLFPSLRSFSHEISIVISIRLSETTNIVKINMENDCYFNSKFTSFNVSKIYFLVKELIHNLI